MQQQEVKGNLAKLLATENLIIEHKVCETAQFNVDTRVLTLPIWRCSDRVYNMLVGHEVGHALYTPATEWGDLPVPKSYINVTEDARIEKLMKRKFPGLSKDFYQGYQELNAEDFFQVQDVEVGKLNLIDRINLHYKIGSYSIIPFDAPEHALRDAVGDAETFEEAIDAAKAIYAYEKQKKEEEKIAALSAPKPDTDDINIDNTPGESQGKADLGDEGETESKTPEAKKDPVEELLEQLTNPSAPSKGAGRETRQPTDTLEAVTDNSLSDSLKGITSDNHYDEVKYVEVPNVDLKHHVVSPHKVNKLTRDYWNCEQFTDPNHDYHKVIDFTEVDAEYRKFKRECSREVNYLAKEFEMKKAASAYARETVSRTGVLDTKKIYSYLYNEDLFKKVTVRPDGKNHGLIFLLDWSGSMADDIHDTYKQLLSLCLFCRKVNIPFDVYAFCQDGSFYPEDYDRQDRYDNQNKVPNRMIIDDSFFLVNHLSSTLNNARFDEYANNLWRITTMFNCRYGFRSRRLSDVEWNYASKVPDAIPPHMGLGGTPLNEAVACLQTLIPEFQGRNKVEKVHVTILTDGDGAHPAAWVESEFDGKKHYHRSALRYNTAFRDRKTGRNYSYDQNCPDFTKQLLRYMKGRFPQCNFLGFRIAPVRDVNRYIEYRAPELKESQKKSMKSEFVKFKCVSAPILGYQEIYFLSSKHLNIETEFEPKSDSKADIKRAYTKSLKGKANNKKILSSFITQIA